jgi:hypothetical protein
MIAENPLYRVDHLANHLTDLHHALNDCNYFINFKVAMQDATKGNLHYWVYYRFSKHIYLINAATETKVWGYSLKEVADLCDKEENGRVSVFDLLVKKATARIRQNEKYSVEA